MPGTRTLDLDYKMTSDVNKWRDVMQNLRKTGSPLFYLHFCMSNALNSDSEYVINRL